MECKVEDNKSSNFHLICASYKPCILSHFSFINNYSHLTDRETETKTNEAFCQDLVPVNLGTSYCILTKYLDLSGAACISC